MRGTSSIQTPSAWQQQMGPASPLMVRRTFSWSFRLAQVTQPLLGAEFLAHHHLLVDVAGHRLLVTDSYATTDLSTSPATHITVCSVDSSPVKTLIAEYSDVFKPELHQQRRSPAKHGIHNHIITSGAPVYSRFRRLNQEKLEAAKTSFTEMERMGICSKGYSPWASPLHMVHKSGDHVETPGVSTSSLSQTTIPCPTLPTSQTASALHVCLVNWTYSKDTFRSLCILLTGPKQQ